MNKKTHRINFVTAKLAKEKGYDGIKLYSHRGQLTGEIEEAPSQDELSQWLREEYDVHIFIPKRKHDSKPYSFEIYNHDDISTNYYPTYELALESGLQEGLKLIENNLVVN